MGRSRAAQIRRQNQNCSQKAGIEFIDENGGGPGVRLRKRPQVKSKLVRF